MSEDKKPNPRSHRRVRKKDMRTITVGGYGERRYGPNSRLNNLGRERTIEFKRRKSRPVVAPVIRTDLPHSLKEGLNGSLISYSIDRSTGIATPRITVDNRFKKQMEEIGTIFEKETSNSFQISSYDLLYGMQVGVLGGTKPERQRLFKQLMEFNKLQDSNFMQKYLVFLHLKNKNYYVLDGTVYGTTFAIVEPMPESVKNELIRIAKNNPEMVGTSPRSKFSVIASGLVDLTTDDMTSDEVIKGQHLTSKADMRYFLATVDDEEYVDDELVDGEVSLYLLRKDRLKKEFRPDVQRKTIILDPYEVRGENE